MASRSQPDSRPVSRPFNARMVAQVCAEQGWRYADLDGGAGYLFAVEDAGRRVLSGSGAVCAYPTNPASAYSIARDKSFTHAALVAAGLSSIPTELVFLESARRHLRAPGREGEDLLARADRMNFPLFVKPNRGAHGDFAETVADRAALADYLGRVARRHDQIVVQPVIDAPEYRVLVVGGQARFQYRKAEGGLAGAADESWQAVFERLNTDLKREALSPIPHGQFVAALEHAGRRAEAISGDGAWLELPGRRNLATGGHPVDFRVEAEAEPAQLAIAATAALGLDVAGVDLFWSKGNPPRVLEVNANPSFASLEKLGQTALARQIWTDILAAALGSAG
ncbi:hypothetical protein [uncultured Maricaulis sp.]|uniref:ATP-grasp domain-containing protein n=1 Tax=uncultured Maricaulis sp. TaxID=174710 RepID=UPI0025E69C9B|nr:hypothetical protein [uncultured Maricaulis sp.]